MSSGDVGAVATAARIKLGKALRELRESQEISVLDAAGVLGCSKPKILAIEVGRHAAKADDLPELLRYYNVTGEAYDELVRLGALSRQRRPRTPGGTALPAWFQKYADLEQMAVRVKVYDESLIPGLFQTEDYARTVISANLRLSAGDVDRLVDARLARQSRLTDEVNPVQTWVVLDEAALRRRVGGTEIMRRQLAHLRELIKLPNVVIRVVPFSAGTHPAAGFPFTLLTLGADDPEVVYLEDLTRARHIDQDVDEQREYIETYDHLVEIAQPPEETDGWLDSLLREL